MAGFNNKFNSAKQEWTTPDNLFDPLNKEFNFNFDLAADFKNTKCDAFFDEQMDGLSQPWPHGGVCWLNPPYGDKKHKLVDWIKKAFEESKQGATIVMLIPARTNTKWWHEYCMNASEVRFICGRPKFGGATHGLPQPLALIIFSDNNQPTKFSTFKLQNN